MTRRALAALLLCLGLALPCGGMAAQPSPAPVEAVRVLRRLPHDAQAFTQGFVLHHGEFYESTGLYGHSSLRRVDPASGRVLARTELPGTLFGEGLALCPDEVGSGKAGRLVQLTWREGVVLFADARTLRPLGRASLPGEAWGLACRGAELALTDGSDVVRLLDARTLAETGRLRVRDGGRPVRRLNELEWVNGWLLANVWQRDVVAVIHPRTGLVALWLDLAALRASLGPEAEAANGIAAGPEGLYLTGKRWDAVFLVSAPALLRRPPGGT